MVCRKILSNKLQAVGVCEILSNKLQAVVLGEILSNKLQVVVVGELLLTKVTKALLSPSSIAVLGKVCANIASLGIESGQDTVKVPLVVVHYGYLLKTAFF